MERPDDETHFDNVFIGRDVPRSVFYKKFQGGVSYKRPFELSAEEVAARIRDEERNRQGQVDRQREKRRQRPGFTKARKK